MNPLKRLALLVFGLAGVVALIALTLPWFGPYKAEATQVLVSHRFDNVLKACICIAFAGVAFELCRALFTPREAKTVAVCKANGDVVTVTTAAIVSSATHIIEQDGDYVADRVTVKAKHSGHVRVFVRVRPVHAVDVTVEGPRLHDRMIEGLTHMCGTHIDCVEIEFISPQSFDEKGEEETAVRSSEVTIGRVATSPKIDASELIAATDVEVPQPKEPVDAPADITVQVPLAPSAAPADHDDDKPSDELAKGSDESEG